MDKVKENLDKEDEKQDATPEVSPPDEKTPAPKKAKSYTEEDLMKRGRDDAALAQKAKELDEREVKIKETETELEWRPIVEKYGKERTDKIKVLGFAPTALDTIAELLDIKVPPTVEKDDPIPDSGDTIGGKEGSGLKGILRGTKDNAEAASVLNKFIKGG